MVCTVGLVGCVFTHAELFVLLLEEVLVAIAHCRYGIQPFVRWNPVYIHNAQIGSVGVRYYYSCSFCILVASPFFVSTINWHLHLSLSSSLFSVHSYVPSIDAAPSTPVFGTWFSTIFTDLQCLEWIS